LTGFIKAFAAVAVAAVSTVDETFTEAGAERFPNRVPGLTPSQR
jgi:hypothetical protein